MSLGFCSGITALPSCTLLSSTTTCRSSQWTCKKSATFRTKLHMKDSNSVETESPPSVSENSPAPSSTKATPQTPVSDDVPFEIRGFSLANFGVFLGVSVTAYSFYGYFSSSGTASATSLGFVYGVPILLIGLALKYAELKPVPVKSTPEGRKLRDVKATEIQKKIIRDVTRHRYGDEAHLDTALKALGLIPRGAACPELLRLTEDVTEEGEYALGMEFFSKETPYGTWEEKQDKCTRFFGPNVTAKVAKLDETKRIVELKLTTTAPTQESSQ